MMFGCIGRRDGSTNTFGNKKDAAVGEPVDSIESLFCLCKRKLKGLFHLDGIAFDISREVTVGYSMNLIAVFLGKAAGVVQKRLIRSIADAWKNDSQFGTIFICFREVSGGFGVQHLPTDIFLKIF